jgi:hypothetical protein
MVRGFNQVDYVLNTLFLEIVDMYLFMYVETSGVVIVKHTPHVQLT